MSTELTADEKKVLLKIARDALETGVKRLPLQNRDPQELTQTLLDQGAAFVTLTIHGELRGCIGALEPYQSLVEDVREHTIAAALEDYRFPQVSESELKDIEIEISRLTLPQQLIYKDPDDLLSKLHPGIDGVIIRDGMRRATFLPQVWDKIPEKESFLENLCYKMGASPDLWRIKHLTVLTYKVEEFHE